MSAISGCNCLLLPQSKALRCRSLVILPQRQPFLPNPHLRPKSPKQTISRILCSSSPSPNSGENESKAVLEAFFLGKAFAEALTERVGSTVGELLSVVGQWQAEQQKQVQDFQEEVLERATKAKEKASREAVAAQASTAKSLTTSTGSGSATVPSYSGNAEPINDQE